MGLNPGKQPSLVCCDRTGKRPSVSKLAFVPARGRVNHNTPTHRGTLQSTTSRHLLTNPIFPFALTMFKSMTANRIQMCPWCCHKFPPESFLCHRFMWMNDLNTDLSHSNQCMFMCMLECTFVHFSDKLRSIKLPFPNIQVFKSDLENIVLNDKKK